MLRRPPLIAPLPALPPGNDTSSHPAGELIVPDKRRRAGPHAAV
jgi:hypothetical protein